MRLLLVCAAILSVCRGAAILDSVAVMLEATPSLPTNYSIPRFVAKSTSGIEAPELYKRILMYKDGKLTKILENGTCVAVVYTPATLTYFGSRDGIFRYDDSTGKVERYGTLHDSIIDILRETRTNDLYILTEDHAVYKVTDEGTKKTEIPEAKGAQEIQLDWDNNLYYYGKDYQPYVVTPNGTKKIQGLPTFSDGGRLFKTLSRINGLTLASDNGSYLLYPDGTSEQYVQSAENRAQSERKAQEISAFFDLISKLEDENNL